MRLITWKKHFPLLELLSESKPTYPAMTPDTVAYAPRDSETINRDKLAYFAASVFWRASVHTWKREDGSRVRIQLGSVYEEEFRRFILGDGPFPSRAALTVFACRDRNSQETFFVPTTARRREYYSHCFVCRGIFFALDVGDRKSVV